MRSILESIGVIVIPDQKAIAAAYQAFDDAGHLKDEKQQMAVAAIGAKLAEITGKLIA